MSTGVFYQPLYRSSQDMKDLSYAKLVGNTNYRMGITWKGDLKTKGVLATNADKSQIYAKFQWGSILGSGDTNHAQYLSTNRLLWVNYSGESTTSRESMSDWRTDMTYGFVDSVSTDILEDSFETRNLRLEIISQIKSPQALTATQQGSGTESLMFIDNIFLEHEGNLPNATGKGYVEIDHFPEQGTLTTNRKRVTAPVTLKLSDGSTSTIDSSGTADRWLHEIQCDFAYMKLVEFDKFIRLQEWQDRGHRLSLHCFLPNIPHTLVGTMAINNVQKSHWDLNRFSFRFSFTENG
jgi:hypothetical protein